LPSACLAVEAGRHRHDVVMVLFPYSGDAPSAEVGL